MRMEIVCQMTRMGNEEIDSGFQLSRRNDNYDVRFTNNNRLSANKGEVRDCRVAPLLAMANGTKSALDSGYRAGMTMGYY